MKGSIMFTSARLKLTAWYLLIIMLVSVSFSLAMYKVLTSELDRVERLQFRQRLPHTLRIDPELLDETKNRLKMILFLINGGIFGASSLAGYFLAGRTLKPIKDMIDEQNRFITDASHELQTPITSLKTEIEVNLRDKKLSKDTKKILISNLEEVNNLQFLSDNLIKLTQYQKTDGRRSFEKISLLEIINEAQKKVTNLAGYKNITIKNDVKNCPVKGDRQSLIELFVIFLDNAIKYSPTGKTVAVSSRRTDSSVEIEFKDQGMGIGEEDIPNLFNRFFRADKSRHKSETGGYGLGLSIAKQIVDRHSGSIKVESEVGRGSTFSIRLPIKH